MDRMLGLRSLLALASGLDPFVVLDGGDGRAGGCCPSDPDSVEKTLYNHDPSSFGLHFWG